MADETTPPEVSPGTSTTEFWKSMVISIVGVALLVYGVVQHDTNAEQWGVILAGISTAGYAISRGLAKAG